MNHLKISESLSQRIRGFLGKILRYIYPFSISKSIYIFFKFIGFFEVNLKGKTFNFFSARDEVAADIFYSGIFGNFEGYSLQLWYLLNKKYTGVVLDIGSYTGIYSFTSAIANEGSFIKAFEPHQRSFHILEKNLKENNLKNINIFNFGLFESTGNIKFYNDYEGRVPAGFTSVNHRHVEKDSSSTICEVRDISEVLETILKNEPICLVKIDIERGEIPVLKRGFDRLYSDKTIILCEILDQEDFTKFENLFTKQDYKKLLIDDENKKYKVVSDLSEAKKVGRNVIFIPLEKIDEALNVIKSC